MKRLRRRRALGCFVGALLPFFPGAGAGAEISRRIPPPAPRIVTPFFTEVARLGGLVDAQGDSDDQFGSAVAIDGDTAVVGVPSRDSAGADAGAAFVFFRAAGVWTLQATLIPPGPADGLGFGSSVAISTDTVVVGATGSYSSLGKAYVYVRSGQTWSAQATLGGLDTVTGDSFGAKVAVSADTAVVSAPQANTGFGYGSGAAYVFTRTGSAWSQQQKLLPADLAADDRFGATVALDGDSVLIGASLDDTGIGVNAGSAYVFTRTGSAWSLQQKLLPATANMGDLFGAAVALSGNVAVVGAPGVDSGFWYDSGSAFVFERSGTAWSQTAILAPPSPTNVASYGNAVAVSGGTAVLGATGGYSASSTPAYVFRAGAGTWALEAALPPDGPIPPYFGTSVAASGSSVLVGAPGFDQTGAAFVFTFPAGAWALQARLDNTGTTRGDAFGSVVVVDGDTMAVGSPGDDTLSARGSGSVTVFGRTGGVWTAQQKLVPEPGDARRFGRSLALEGDLLVVGAGEYYFSSGSVYLFRKSGSWSQEQKLTPTATNTDFGASVATSGGTVLVGEPNAEVDGVYGAGAVSAFVRPAAAWVVQQRLKAPTPEYYSRFGTGLALGGDTAVIGAPDSAPRAYVFRRSSGVWTSRQELRGDQAGEAFGTAIALYGSAIAIGSPGDNSAPPPSGSVYVFQEASGTYSVTERLRCPSTTYYVRCGAAVALSSDTLLVGAPQDAYTTVAGSALVFDRGAGPWTLRQQLLPSGPTPPPSFGAGGALAGSQVLVGSPHADEGAHDSGAVHVFGPATSDLSLTMVASPLVVSQGDQVTVSLTLANAGPVAVTGTAAALTLPGLVFSSYDNGNCVAAPGGAVCSFGAVASGVTGSVDFFAAAAAVGTFTSTATVAAGGPSAQATTTILAANADLILTMTTPTEARRGQTLDYWLTVRNDGPSAAGAVLVTHATPPGLVLDRVSGPSCASLPCLIPRIPVNWSDSIRATYRVPVDYAGPDPIVNTATVTAGNGDPVLGNNTASGTTPLVADTTRLRFYTVSPCRLVDTRDAARGGPLPLSSGPARYTAGAGACGVPYAARALAVNVTATQPTAAGYLKLYPDDAGPPLASFVNYQAGQTRSNNGVIGLDASSRFVVEVGQAGGTVHLIVDVVGYFQ